ncbi:MAG: phospholipase D-like domain-containing protein [Bacteroidia bacterium]|nr:phospholipase D-like domain-containing protein [Bacteroidia bacterium]
MIVHANIKSQLETELQNASSVWIASAMISYSGWDFIQKAIPPTSTQFYLIGIDLATEPKVFESILSKSEINARIYETQFTFHPKVYLIKKQDGEFTAFIGSSNTTKWGLEKNVEMNFQIHDQAECQKLLSWFNSLYADGYIITDDFLKDYKIRFVKTNVKTKEIEKEAKEVKKEISKNKGQFFSRNHHEIFNEKFHRVNSLDLQRIRKEVRDKFRALHFEMYPQFSAYGLTDLHCHHQSREIVSRHFFNQYSGNYINAMWLHYGKSQQQLQKYASKDKSINKPDSFINNIRMQVIIHEGSLGIWLVLGRNNGSKIDRDHFRKQMTNPRIRKDFFDAIKKLGNDYWLNISNTPLNELTTPDELWKETQRETIDEYIIIGCDINWLDNRLSNTNISATLLKEFQKLYQLYEIMRHR